MNKNFANRILLCLVAVTMTCMPETKASCVSSGFGVGLTLGTQKNTVKFKADNLNKLVDNTRTDLIKKLTDAITATKKKFNEQNTKDTEMVDGSKTHTFDAYTDTNGNIDGAPANGKELSKQKTPITFKTKKFNSDNPTQYRIADSSKETHGKYDNNGMHDDDKGTSVREAILVNPNIVTNNNFTGIFAANAFDSSTLDCDNYYGIQNANGNLYTTPKNGFVLSEMNKALDDNTVPTHVLLDDLSGDKTTYKFLESVFGNSSTLAKYKETVSGDELFKDPDTGKYYINTVKHKDLGLSDTFINSAIDTLSPKASTSQTFKDVSKWSFDIGAIIFYQYRIYDWFVRGGLFGNFPIANKKVSIMEGENKSNNNSKDKSSDSDFSLEHSFDVGAQILGGYNITQAFAIIFGLEFGYSKWKLNNLDKLASKYSLDNSLLVQWVKAGNANALDDYNKSLKDMGLSDKEKKFGKWFWRGLIGFEYNFSNFIIGLQGFFGPNIKLMKASNNSDLGDLTVSNMGARLTLAYKF